ncbi:RDD family protein [Mycobacterium sp.]|uniref:RDD family protein n=1 Tax=Mycobacterium sp. TaxID=1785 RepID=UPI003C746DAB
MTRESPPSYPGETLGLPASGSGSLASTGRRLLALLIDWLIAAGLALLALRFGAISESALATTQLVVWLVLGAVAVRLYGFTPGQLALGLEVAAVDDRVPVGIGRALARGGLIFLLVPPLFIDSDGRGLQDRLTGTAVLRR